MGNLLDGPAEEHRPDYGNHQYPRHPVTMIEALALVRAMEEVAAAQGYHTALTGGVLYRGSSTKDVDVVIYPHQIGKGSHKKENLLAAFQAAGATEIFQTDGEYIDKDVVLMTFMGKRVDLFFL